MKFEGIVKVWHDDRGFGFIEPAQGGQDIFVHIKSFQGLRGRPQANQRVTFRVETGPQGKKRALDVEIAGATRPAVAPKRAARASAPWGLAARSALIGFVLLAVLGYLFGEPPRVLLWAYPAMSLITFIAYALDKSAAQRGAWRTSEQTLHLLALLCGWPGALLAQQLLRHKTVKAQFRTVFWITVIVNVAGFVYLCTPHAAALTALVL